MNKCGLKSFAFIVYAAHFAKHIDAQQF